MDENPYQKFVTMFRNPDPADGWQMCEGKVISVRPDAPYRFEVFGLIFQEGQGIRCNQQLVNGLQVGDRLLCLADASTLYILMKVVPL